jgi:hypothetical protein
MYYTDTKEQFPNHSLNKKLEEVVGADNLSAWGRTLRTHWLSKNVLGLNVAAFNSDQEFQVSAMSFAQHLSDQNKALVALNTVQCEKFHALECQVNRIESNVNRLENKLDTVISLLLKSRVRYLNLLNFNTTTQSVKF